MHTVNKGAAMLAKDSKMRKGSNDTGRTRRVSKTNRFDPRLYAAITVLAKQERRSTSNLIESLMAAHVARSAFS
jgi:hypothetical protein